MRATKYSREVLAPLVETSRTLGELIRRLGLPATGGNYRHISTRIRQAGLDTTHFGNKTFAARCDAMAPEMLASLVRSATSIAHVLAKLDLPLEGRSHHELTRRIRELEIDSTHLRGRGWSRGETSATHPAVKRTTARKTYPDTIAFSENAPPLSGPDLGRRLRAMGWKYSCTWCGIHQWRDKPLTLHLDHINGIHNDNRLLNLRFLCPNCHSQTETYGNRRR